jgi:hypothetical protein
VLLSNMMSESLEQQPAAGRVIMMAAPALSHWQAQTRPPGLTVIRLAVAQQCRRSSCQ